MQRLNIGLGLGGLAAVAAGVLGGWALFDGLPLQASALAPVEIASPSIAEASSAEPASVARSPAGQAMPNPALAPAPSPAVEAPPPAPPAAANEEAGKPHIHLDGERSALSYEGQSGGLYISKDRMSVRTPFGKFDIDW
jgi:hypothetical protein